MSTPKKIVDESLKLIIKLPKIQEKDSHDPLLAALLDSKIEVAEKLMDTDADVEALLEYRDPINCDTILTWAVRHNKLEVIQFIIKYPLFLSKLYEVPNSEGHTPRFLAALQGNTYILFTLFRENKLKVLEYRNSKGASILDSAIVGNLESGIKFLLSLPNIAAYIKNHRLLIPKFFNYACDQGNKSLIELLFSLIPAQEIIRTMENLDYSPILDALKNRNVLMFAFLLHKYTYKAGIIKSLITLQRKEIFQYSRAIHTLLDQGLTLEYLLNFRDAQQNTILCLLAENGGIEFLKFLLIKPEFKNLINIPNLNGETPLLLAALNGKRKCFNCLLERRGDPEVLVKYRAKNGDPLLHSIARLKETNIVPELLKIEGIKQQSREKNQDTLLPILLACFAGNVYNLNLLLKQDIDFSEMELHNYRVEDGGNVFHILIKNNKSGELNQMIDFLASTEIVTGGILISLLFEKNINGEEPLVLAVRKNCVYSVGVICMHMVDKIVAQIKLKNGNNIISEAVHLGYKDVLSKLISVGSKSKIFSDIADEILETGISARMLAIIQGDVEIQKILGVTEEQYYTLYTPNNATMLSEAAARGYLNGVKLLLQHQKVKDSIEVVDKFGFSAIFRAAAFGNREIVELLIKNGSVSLKQLAEMRVNDNKKSVLTYAAMQGNINGLRYLLAMPEFTHLLNYQNTDGQTALMYTCHFSFVDTFKFLLDQGARVDVKDCDGSNLFTQAKNTPEITKEMVDVVAGVKDFLELPQSPIFNGLRKVDADSLKEFREKFASCLKRGASLNIRTEKGNTLLHLATLSCNTYLIHELYKAGANLYALNDDGKTALQLFRDSQAKDLSKKRVIACRCTLLILHAREAYKENERPGRFAQCIDYIGESLKLYLDIEDKEIQGQFCLELAHWIKEEPKLLEIFKIETVVELESAVPKESSLFEEAQFDLASLQYIEGRHEAAYQHIFQVQSYEGADVLRKEIQSTMEEEGEQGTFRKNKLDLLDPKGSLLFLKEYLKKMTPVYRTTDELLERTVAAKEEIEALQDQISAIKDRNNVMSSLKRKERPLPDASDTSEAHVSDEPFPKKLHQEKTNEGEHYFLNLEPAKSGTKRKSSAVKSEVEESEADVSSTAKKIKSKKFS